MGNEKLLVLSRDTIDNKQDRIHEYSSSHAATVVANHTHQYDDTNLEERNDEPDNRERLEQGTTRSPTNKRTKRSIPKKKGNRRTDVQHMKKKIYQKRKY